MRGCQSRDSPADSSGIAVRWRSTGLESGGDTFCGGCGRWRVQVVLVGFYVEVDAWKVVAGRKLPLLSVRRQIFIPEDSNSRTVSSFLRGVECSGYGATRTIDLF